jgi:hypothetical protein
MTRTTFLALAALALPVAAGAQGSLSTQGLGYPQGQLSTRALTMGGSLGEFDPHSALNPAALDAEGRSSLYVQYEPEFRSVEVGDASTRTTTARFPMIAGTMRAGERLALALSASTLLDRSWQATVDTTRVIDGVETGVRERYRSLGSIADVRLAASYALGRDLRAGIALHGITGEHRLDVSGEFGDSTELTLQTDAVSYGGLAMSAGVEWRLSSVLAIAGSARKGGTIKARSDGEVLQSAHVPDRFGAGVRYAGIRGSILSARADWIGWSKLGDLASSAKAFDTWDLGAGVDAAGPRFAARIVTVRGGLRWRTLPFGVGDTEVKELSASFGAGVPLARERAAFDLGVVHARRTAGDLAKERSWILSFGLTVRP